jgi:UDP-N-acetylmuramoyl-tripeptide--D-alanyl-D-alanine ligase
MSSLISNLYKEYLKHPNITTDSRNISQNSIFFALKGDNFDGNEYALKSLELGCNLVVVDDLKLKDTSNCYYVPNVLTALQKLAKLHREKLNIPIIGITGTNGKTTTKELIAAVLSTNFNTQYTKGNLNNHIGVPLSILSINKKHEIAVIEMGANHIGEIETLCKIAQPTHGIITNVGKAHLEGFGSFKGVIKAKTELYQYLVSRKGSIAFINAGNSILMEHGAKLNSYTYGLLDKADCIFEDIIADPFVKMKWNSDTIKSKLIGKYNAENIMAAVCIGDYFEVETDDITKTISEYTPKNQRSELVKTQSNKIILDAYNANPSSMKEAIKNFKQMNTNSPMLILGDMFELGTYSFTEHQKIIQIVKEYCFKEAVFVGNNFHQIINNIEFTSFKTTEEARLYFSKTKISERNILIKGSRGMQLENLITVL